MTEPKVEVRKLSEFRPLAANPNRHTQRGLRALEDSVQEDGWVAPITVTADGESLDGAARLEVAADKFDDEALVISHDGQKPIIMVRTDIPDAQSDIAKRVIYNANRVAEIDLDWNLEQLLADAEALPEGLWTDEELAELLAQAGVEPEPPADAEPQFSRADELLEKWGVEYGSLWRIGEHHRLLCGDSTVRADVERVMQGERAELCHADPPYGMGKEKEGEGVANDNLYREKLDAFQMAWWKACRPSLADNASAYIWGNADDLWRLWYCGGLCNSERLTFRNEIVWSKDGGQGIGSETHRQYPTVSERCLFFMLGEQGFSNNADNYWEGWEPIRAYLEQGRKEMGWDIPTMKRIVGHSDLSRDHWTGKSQWNFPTREVYEKLQAAARGDAFKRDYDDLKRDFYATRAYFDNTHDNMTDVWEFGRVIGEERWEHPTPKPVEMIMRCVKSSTPECGVVFDPFVGSGTTLVACQNLGRQCRAIEIHPPYVSVCLERMATAFPHLEIEKIE